MPEMGAGKHFLHVYLPDGDAPHGRIECRDTGEPNTEGSCRYGFKDEPECLLKTQWNELSWDMFSLREAGVGRMVARALPVDGPIPVKLVYYGHGESYEDWIVPCAG